MIQIENVELGFSRGVGRRFLRRQKTLPLYLFGGLSLSPPPMHIHLRRRSRRETGRGTRLIRTAFFARDQQRQSRVHKTRIFSQKTTVCRRQNRFPRGTSPLPPCVRDSLRVVMAWVNLARARPRARASVPPDGVGFKTMRRGCSLGVAKNAFGRRDNPFSRPSKVQAPRPRFGSRRNPNRGRRGRISISERRDDPGGP